MVGDRERESQKPLGNQKTQGYDAMGIRNLKAQKEAWRIKRNLFPLTYNQSKMHLH